jgi:hypothetical protein
MILGTWVHTFLIFVRSSFYPIAFFDRTAKLLAPSTGYGIIILLSFTIMIIPFKNSYWRLVFG